MLLRYQRIRLLWNVTESKLKTLPQNHSRNACSLFSPFGLEKESQNISFIRLKPAFVYPKPLLRALQAIKWEITTHKASQTLTLVEFHHWAGQILLACFEQELLEEVFSVGQKAECLAVLWSPLPAFPIHCLSDFSSMWFLLHTHCADSFDFKATTSPKQCQASRLLFS